MSSGPLADASREGRALCKRVLKKAQKNIFDKNDVTSLVVHALKREREIHHLRARQRAERAMLKEEIRQEFVLVEAASARVDERQRQLFERNAAQAGALDAYTRGRTLSAHVDASIASLCMHAPSTPHRDCARLSAENGCAGAGTGAGPGSTGAGAGPGPDSAGAGASP